ncbi:hypothetical protein ACHAWO_009077 [Cyclotella atomus]|uniref:BAP29/BAP31 transmembrane domain-containing protein n=1 Tax=Cyclotella atomus TaxID=382360 RepID=A0ABD3QA84_9STRA
MKSYDMDLLPDPDPMSHLAIGAVFWNRKAMHQSRRRIFFTRVSVGTVYIRLVWVSVGFSCLIFWIACRTLQRGFGSARVPCDGISCPFHTGETMWYRKASRYRAERNFWLSLFTLVLWLLVYKMYSLKETIVKLKAKMADSSNGQQKTEQDKKKD